MAGLNGLVKIRGGRGDGQSEVARRRCYRPSFAFFVAAACLSTFVNGYARIRTLPWIAYTQPARSTGQRIQLAPSSPRAQGAFRPTNAAEIGSRDLRLRLLWAEVRLISDSLPYDSTQITVSLATLQMSSTSSRALRRAAYATPGAASLTRSCLTAPARKPARAPHLLLLLALRTASSLALALQHVHSFVQIATPPMASLSKLSQTAQS